MNRQWKLATDKFKFDAIDLANLFVNATRRWYEEEIISTISGNVRQGLFGKRDIVRAAIVAYLESGKEPDSLEIIYALGKFQAEWMSGTNKFFEPDTNPFVGEKQ